jgi:DNA-binding PadR family transcriptional regulator
MRQLFLTLLSRHGAYGYELRQAFERQFGDLLPTLNAGQITPLSRGSSGTVSWSAGT